MGATTVFQQQYDLVKQLFTTLPNDPTNPQGIYSYFQNIIDVMPNNVYWVDKHCRMLGCNRNTLKVVGLSRLEDFIGKTYEELAVIANWKEGQAESFKRDDMAVMTTGIAKYNVEEPPLYAENGEATYYISSRVPLYDAQNNIVGIVGISVDITERKKMELALIDAKEEAENANIEKSKFMENMSHDFKTPLNGIYGVVQILRDRKDLPDDIKELVNAQEKSVVRLKNLIDTILDFERLNTGKVQVYYEPINLLEIIESIVDNLSNQSRNKNLSLILEYPPEIPNYLISDSHCMTSIILNLMSNAVKFTDKGYINVSVKKISQDHETILLNIAVEDSGIGIKEEQIPHIFDRFNRIEPSNTGLKSGHGLGLAIVKELVNKLNGTLSVKSQFGVGSTFSVSLPFKLQDTALIIFQWQNLHPHIKVLLVNDKKTGTDTILDQLGSERVKKVKSADVIDSLISASQSQSPYHIIIIDSEIEFIDAFDLIKIIKATHVIQHIMPLLSTHPQDNNWFDKARLAGYFDFIIKPILPSELHHKLTGTWEKWQRT